MRLGDLDDLKVHISELMLVYSGEELDNAILNAIDNAPTVPLPDFKEGYKQAIRDGKTNFSRPQGEWIITREEQGAFGIIYKMKKCNRCDWESSLLIPRNFCPNCGADMRGGT